MQRYLIQRTMLIFPTLFLITVLTFVGLRVVIPADVVDIMTTDYGGHDAQLRAYLEEQFGLADAVPKQYAEWVGIAWFWGGETGILQGDLGNSLFTNRPVTTELARRLPVSLELGMWGLVTTLALSIPLGVVSALKQDKLPDYGLRSMAILLAALPNFWIAILIITFGSIWFNWAPPIRFVYLHEDPIAHFKIMMLPALIIGLTPSGGLIRLMRTQMLEVLRQDYIRTAHAKGLSQNAVVYRHALRNALIPIVTVIGVSLPGLISGTVIFEQIFIIPGMGRYFVTAVNSLDYPVIQGLVVVFSTLLLLSVLIVDISYAYLDPRIRYD